MDVLFHEVGHAYDLATGFMSRSEGFKAAFNSVNRELWRPYYLQLGNAGLSEAFAESFATYFSGCPAYAGGTGSFMEYRMRQRK